MLRISTFPFARLSALALATSIALTGCYEQGSSLLVGRAVLPAATFADGPTSGRHLGAGPINGQAVPFVNKQPVQGFSAVLNNGDGSFLVMSDNGFGSLENSADYNLRLYRITPDFKTTKGGSGEIAVGNFIELKDPNKKIPFTITNHFTSERVLTGADFDIESVQRAPDGSLWFGDEFGPFLIHTDANGVVLDAPIPLPDLNNPGKFIRAPQNPLQEEASAVRIMNAVTRHAELHGGTRTPVFSPYHVMLADNNTANDHYARGAASPADLKAAASDVFNITSLKNAGYPVVSWTVNDKPRMLELLQLGVSGIISDRPDLLLEAVQEFNGGQYLRVDGLIDGSKLDAQGHRGGRNLRPENTLPAMEVALDNLMITLETDSGVSQDKVALLAHDPYVEPEKCRRTDGGDFSAPVLIKNLTAAEIQSTFICDKLFRGESQLNDQALSPVSVAFAASRSIHPYAMPQLQQLFDFVDAYVSYYRDGAGSSHPQAALRWKNAAQVRFNIETKINPRSDLDIHGNVYKDRTLAPAVFTDVIAGLISSNGLAARADVQSFDFRTLLDVQARFPAIRTVYLFGDFPIFAGADSDDGTNLQDENGANSPWLAGLFWPYRETTLTSPFKAQGSGGFEGMALSKDGKKLLPLLEKPLTGGTLQELLIHEFDLASKQYTGKFYRYLLDARGAAIGDFIMTDKKHGLIIERDNTQGDLNGFKTVQEITLGKSGEPVEKSLRVDLMQITDKFGLAQPSLPGDVGVGSETFAFPFTTIEDLVLLDNDTLGVINDNNFPFSLGRHPSAGAPDDNEFILLKLPPKLLVKKK
ncbi:MAG TPA: esterase-like activity of phytase family protein [Dongiaceae bacterium]|nr:esterase-like activity of phytase family protein [Dongiaceae bacterium]